MFYFRLSKIVGPSSISRRTFCHSTFCWRARWHHHQCKIVVDTGQRVPWSWMFGSTQSHTNGAQKNILGLKYAFQIRYQSIGLIRSWDDYLFECCYIQLPSRLVLCPHKFVFYRKRWCDFGQICHVIFWHIRRQDDSNRLIHQFACLLRSQPIIVSPNEAGSDATRCI